MRSVKPRIGIAIAAAAAGLVAAHPRPALANPGNGAFIIRLDGVCSIGGDLIGFDGLIVANVQDVQNVAGGSNFRCSGDIPDGFAPPRSVAVKVGCSGPVGDGVGTVVFTPSGNVTLTCHIPR